MAANLDEGSGQDDPAASAGFPEAFGRTVQVLRTHQGWSRAELAKRAGISYSYLSALENGTKPPSGKMQLVLAGALGVKMHELIAAAEARLSPTGPDAEVTRAAELDQALTRRDQRMAARLALDLPPLATDDSDAAAFTELRDLLTRMSEDDVALLLDMARRLAGRD